MQGHLDRAELISRLITDLSDEGADRPGSDPRLPGFARAVLGRVDDGYLFRHRMTTLDAQLRDSFQWASQKIPDLDIRVRAFRPRLDSHGYSVEGNVIETLMPDQPFIFDTLKLYMEQAGIRVLNSLRIILPVKLDDEGRLAGITANDESARRVSYTRWYADWPTTLPHDEVAAEIARRLGLARAMVEDFNLMIREVKGAANDFDYLATTDPTAAEDCAEVRDFLAWLIEDNFVFMGLSAYAPTEAGGYQAAPARGLGIVRELEAPSGDETVQTLDFFQATRDLVWPLARVRKSGHDSVLHRRGKVDEILVRTFDHRGKAAGGLVLHGMFTFKGLGEPGGSIPILRRKLDRVVSDAQTVRTSYDHKGLIHAFNALPVEFLFEAGVEAIENLIRMTVQADDSRDIRGHIATQPESTNAYAFVVMPKENYSDDLRSMLQTVLQAELGAAYADHRVHLGKYSSVALHFYLTGDTSFDHLDLEAIERKLVEVGTPWTLRLRRALEAEFGEAVAAGLFARYAEAFSEGYIEITSPSEATTDVRHLERVLESGKTRFDIIPSGVNKADALLRIYSVKDLLLTEILPVVDNFGVVVAEQYAFEVTPERAPGPLYVNTLRIRRGDPDLLDHSDELIGALIAVFERKMRSDRLNRVLLPARLSWREVDVLRAYFHYSRQLASQLTIEIVQKTLIAHREFALGLAELFRSRFDPDLPITMAQREDRQREIERRLLTYLDGVAGFEEDRILRTFLNYVHATVRTNVYRLHADGSHFISFKIDCGRILDMPSPRPMYEIYVHHADVEGVHLRGGKVARGGLRWSDRLDDYRSEVLGLMATQMLKNTLIVPVGAKGGFVLKTPPEDYAEARQRADELYRVFIRGLLELTDNIVDQALHPPDRVVRYDDDDPYLVVAADKGTAHLSDAANALAAEHGFWLGDAFASGGSVGYDHKDKGITARGAWVCVRRHFLEMGIDPERDVITCTGIGDMSGDVFGNGLLSSRTIKLIGAFNHRHVFVDPDPDPARSFEERARLFALGRSSWTDYDPKVISPGGGVFERGAKSINLSHELRARLRTDQTVVSGEALIRLILAADVDLLWNGGIGTYIKSPAETHADVGDADNDRVRVDASELRCRVIGEGGNLGITMRGRVDFAGAGGRINLDAIDNSGGVDLSDHEVNLKTLLNPEVVRGALTRAERDHLLIEVGDEVCDAVLVNSDGQALALSLDERRSRDDIWAFVHAMMFLRDELDFSRRTERLPRGTEFINQRMVNGLGFLRPELAKLLSFTKMLVYRDILARPLGGPQELRRFLVDYFPPRVVAAHDDALDRHFLFDEIAATVQTNRVIDLAGVTFLPRMSHATERRPSEITAAYLVADDLLGISPLRHAIRYAPDLEMDQRYRGLIRIEDQIARAVRSLLWTWPDAVTLEAVAERAPVRDATGVLEASLDELAPDRVRRLIRDDAQSWLAAGLERATADRMARIGWLDHAMPLARLAVETDTPLPKCAEHYLGLGFASRVFDLAHAVERQSYADRWDNVAVHSLIRSLLVSVSRMARARLVDSGRRGDATRWLAAHGLDDVASHIAHLLQERIPVSAMLVVSERLKHRLDRLAA